MPGSESSITIAADQYPIELLLPDMRHCELCQKTSRMAATRRLLRGHYNPTNWTRKYPNLQQTRLPDGTRALVCTQCLRTMSKPARKVKIKISAPTAGAVK